VHLQNTADALLLLLGGVEHGGTGIQHTGVDSDKGQPAYEGIGGNLERQGGEGGVVGSGALVLLLSVRIHALDGGDVQGRGHIIHDGVQQLLHALVLVGRSAGHGNQQVLNGALAQSLPDELTGDLLLLQGQFHNLIVQVGAGVDELGTVLLGQLHHVLRDGLHTHVLAQIVIVYVGIHLHQVDDPLEGLLGSDGKLDGNGVALKAVMDHIEHVVKVGAHDVHLIDIDHAGDLIVVSLAPYRLRLRLHAALGAHNGHTAVQHA